MIGQPSHRSQWRAESKHNITTCMGIRPVNLHLIRQTATTEVQRAQLILRLCSFTFERFHALLNSLFKVLFNFPSWYLFAIEIVLYLALDGVYHPIWAAFANNPTLGTNPGHTVLFIRALHPLWAWCHNHVDLEHFSMP